MCAVPIPKDDSQILKAMQLYRSPRIGPKSYYKLVEGLSDFDEALTRLIHVAKKNNIPNYRPASIKDMRKEYEAGLTFGARLVFWGSADYPPLLAQAEDAPPFLWIKGKKEMISARGGLAIIGSRNPTIEGVQIARQLAREAGAAGIPIVSGLARGIDTAAHEGALETGTIGVVAGGLDVLYPKSNARLQEAIGECGALVSEMPLGFQPQAKSFPQRNRIIAGISEAVLVVEAGMRSGTRITVNDCLTIGREVMAVPGHPSNGLSALPNQMIKEGANMVRDIDDILEVIAAIPKESKAAKAASKAPIAAPDSPQKLIRASSIDLGSSYQTGQELAKIGRAMLEGRATMALDGKVHYIEPERGH